MKVKTILKNINKLEQELYQYTDKEIWEELRKMKGGMLLGCIAEGLEIDEQ